MLARTHARCAALHQHLRTCCSSAERLYLGSISTAYRLLCLWLYIGSTSAAYRLCVRNAPRQHAACAYMRTPTRMSVRTSMHSPLKMEHLIGIERDAAVAARSRPLRARVGLECVAVPKQAHARRHIAQVARLHGWPDRTGGAMLHLVRRHRRRCVLLSAQLATHEPAAGAHARMCARASGRACGRAHAYRAGQWLVVMALCSHGPM